MTCVVGCRRCYCCSAAVNVFNVCGIINVQTTLLSDAFCDGRRRCFGFISFCLFRRPPKCNRDQSPLLCNYTEVHTLVAVCVCVSVCVRVCVCACVFVVYYRCLCRLQGRRVQLCTHARTGSCLIHSAALPVRSFAALSVPTYYVSCELPACLRHQNKAAQHTATPGIQSANGLQCSLLDTAYDR